MSRPGRTLLFALLFGMALSPATATQTKPLSRAEVMQLLRHAGHGEVFRLDEQQARIADPHLALLARARLAASKLDAQAACDLVDEYIASAPQPGERSLAWAITADASFADGDYVTAAKAAHAWARSLGNSQRHADERTDAQQMAGLADLLASVAPQTVDDYEPRAEALTRDKVGLLRANVRVNGKPQAMVIDTGANLSVMSLSTAHTLGLRMLDGDAHVGSASQQAVASRIGIAEHLHFAGLDLSDVPFLVLDDAQLAMPVPGGYQIDAILGFPVLRQLQRLTFTADGKLLPARSSGDAQKDANLRMVGSDLYVKVQLGDMPVAMHLDSGASHSSLSARFAAEHASMVKGWRTRKEGVGGAGGSRTRRVATWSNVDVGIGVQHVTLPTLAVALDSAGNVKEPNVLGNDILRAFDQWTLDFQRMEFTVGEALHETSTRSSTN
ncbi:MULTISPECIES: aspartyl protease family protein [Dyella]|uniref:Peptidase A2 domain-containing protein n=2 Tax=Dyella TaxID=231454 RepID=A0A4R0YX11_9GAMM|nr:MULTISPECIES: aspartyl protease family protein [Dyella]TBR40539.1 hypothetical protein EYV96_10420 [Dyella terrae]TCI11879.1 hypothetical protein EZM97_00450 [Dyella soli]